MQQTPPPPQQQQPPPPQNQSYEYNPPKPYSWKTDEFQVQQDTRQQPWKTAQEINRVQPVSNFNQPQPLVYQPQAPAMAHGYRCPRCGTQNLPHLERKISPAGWIVFVVLLLVFFPLFWVGFLIKEDVHVCPVCNLKVD
ncbi:MAG TPA: LITAF-like zinc ribbon domain-containing protein [Pyrinomonadaceae bacterium]|nr:LITAF-like zinc ribbon domain-containing protein [Pyrinomonadaceae bacterium]